MSKSNTGRNTTALAVIAALAITGGVWYFRQNPQPSPSQPEVTAASPAPESPDTPTGILPSPPSQQTGEAGTEADKDKLFIYTVATNDNGSYLDKKPFSTTDAGASGNDKLAAIALEAMAEEGENSPLPKGTKVTSVIFDKDLATVDFNEAFQKNFTGGDENEALTLNAVLATVGQFPGVKQVQILVAGQKIDSLGGNQPLDAPLPIPNNFSVAKSGQ